MWDILEHYKFLKHLFNYGLEKVQESAFFSVLANAILILMGYFNYFADHIVGVSASFIIMVAVVMSVDLITGLKAAKKEKQDRTSKKGLRWVFKLGSYIMFVYGLNTFIIECSTYGFDWLQYPLNLLKMYVIGHILFWETKSIDENFERLGYSLRILKLADEIWYFFRDIVKKKVDDAQKN